MLTTYCYGYVCFIPLNTNAPKFFGFSEFLSGLALMVLAWTIADVRYRFRVRTAPIPLEGVTFSVVGVIGILTLLTDWWRAEQWLVPQGNFLTPASWQALLGGVFLLTFLSWAWFAFIRPPVYGRRNAKRYAQVLYRAILKSSVPELSVIADELTLSVKSLISYASDESGPKYSRKKNGGEKLTKKTPDVTAFANDILLIVADRRFCRVIIESSSITALVMFQSMGDAKKYGIQISVFAKNILNEAILNKDSFLYHETEGYETGFMGYSKPLSHAMFSNYSMVETIGTSLDPYLDEMRKWDVDQWRAYSRVVLMVFRDYVEQDVESHSFTLYRAKRNIENAVSDLYKLNGVENSSWDDDVHGKLRVAVEFIKDAIEILNIKGAPKYLQLRVRDKRGAGSIYDQLADMIFEVIFSASAVKSPVSLCWWVQHNSVWGELFNFGRLDGAAAKIVKFKVRRLIYNEIVKMEEFPNFKGAKILGFCLNVMGLSILSEDYDRDSKALHKAILSWTKRNYAWLHSFNSRVAEGCLVDGVTYDVKHFRLVKTYPIDGLRREPHYVYLEVDRC